MKKLSAKQIKQWNDLRLEVEGARDALEIEVNAYNALLEEAWQRVESALDRVADTITAADEYRAEIAGEMQSYFDDRSETWQEGDAGSNYTEWINEWDQDLPEVELDRPEDLEVPEVEAISQMENLPESPVG